MLQGCFINMENKGALITVAMLSTFLNQQKKDYLDLLNPFIIDLFPKTIGDKVEADKIAKGLKEEYGLENMPVHVIKKILNRNAKLKVGILKKENNEYYIKKAIDTSEFKDSKKQMKEDTEVIVGCLIKNLESNTFMRKVSFEEGRDIFVDFLDSYGFTTINNVDDLKSITAKREVNRNNYYVARFILEEHNKESTIFDKITELIKGFLIYKSIFFFASEQKKTLESKLNGTDIYIDTSILINALGYNTKEEKKATNQLVELIIKNKGKVKTFTHNEDEVAGILTKYAMDPVARNSMRLQYFRENKYERYDVIRHRESLSTNLNKLGIEIVDTPEYGNVSTEDFIDKGYLDYEELARELSERIKYRNNSKDSALLNDVDSIVSISRIRGQRKRRTIEDCKAIFVTQNIKIVTTVNDLYKDRFSNGEISFVISEIDLTSLLWLSSFSNNTDLPCLKLMECVYAAHQPTDEIIEMFIANVNQLELEGNIDANTAILMRTQTALREDLMEETENDPSKLSEDTVKKIENKYTERLRSADDEKIRALKKTITKQEEEELERRCKAYDRAEKVTEVKAKQLEKVLVVSAKIVMFTLIVLGIYITILEYNHNQKRGFFLVIIGILGIYDTFSPRFELIKKALKR